MCTSTISVSDTKQAIELSDRQVQILDSVQQTPITFLWNGPFHKCSWSSVQGCLSSTPCSEMEAYDDPGDYLSRLSPLVWTNIYHYGRCVTSIASITLLDSLQRSCLPFVGNRKSSILLRNLGVMVIWPDTDNL